MTLTYWVEIAAARRQEQDRNAPAFDLVHQLFIMMPRCIVEDEDGPGELGVVLGLESALQHPQEPSVSMAIVAFTELIPEVVSFV